MLPYLIFFNKTANQAIFGDSITIQRQKHSNAKTLSRGFGKVDQIPKNYKISDWITNFGLPADPEFHIM